MKNDVTYVYLDIETIPDQREGAPERAAARVQAPSNYKDAAKIAAYVAEKAGEAHAKTSFDGAYGQVFCIGYAVGDRAPQAVVRQMIHDLEDEAAVLVTFFEDLLSSLQDSAAPYGDGGEYRVAFVGHRVAKFDLRFLWQRCLVHGVTPSVRLPYDASPYGGLVVDTGYLWTGSPSESASLDTICQALGIPTPKDGIDGSQVWPRVQAGDWESVVKYNLEDVRATREIHQRVLRVRGY